MDNYRSPLDSARFGFPVAKIPNDINEPREVIEELRGQNVKLIIARIELNNVKLLNKLEEIGFQTKDIQLTFNFDLQKELPKANHADYVLTDYKDRHLHDLIEMTRLSFQNYGHYFADDRLDKDKCLEIYTDWITRCCQDASVADRVIVAEINDVAIGYLAIKNRYEKNNLFCAGVIGAVDPEYRKFGVFKNINIESLCFAKELGAARVENNVLATNIPVMRTYTSLSYEIIRSEATLHYWIG